MALKERYFRNLAGLWLFLMQLVIFKGERLIAAPNCSNLVTTKIEW